MTNIPSQSKRCFLVLLACFQNLLMGGVIFGWASISNTMLTSSTSAPALNPSHIHDMFIMGTSANMCSPLFLGIVLDKYGPRASSVISILCSFAGFLLFGLANSLSHSDLVSTWLDRQTIFSVAIVGIGFGGPGVQNAVIHLANLFPSRKGLVTAIITGCFQLSFVVFFIFDQLWFFGNIDYRTLFIGHACLCFFALLTSIIFWPDQPYHFGDVEIIATPSNSPITNSPVTNSPSTPNRKKKFRGSKVNLSKNYVDAPQEYPSPLTYDKGQQSSSRFSLVRYPSFFQHDDDVEVGNENSQITDSSVQQYQAVQSQEVVETKLTTASSLDRPKDKELLVQLKSMQFVCATSLLTISSFWANFYIGAVDLQLSSEHYMSKHDQAACMRWFTIITTAGVLGVPVVGSCIDKLGLRITLMITVALGCLWSACTLIADRNVLLFSFGVYALFRTFLFNYYFTFVADRLGFRFFGILAGASFFIAAVFGLLQAPLLAYIQSPCVEFGATREECEVVRWKMINTAKLISIACLFGFTVRFKKSPQSRPHGKEINTNLNKEYELISTPN
mmetsp:Transcript_26080/g.30896  ORF Transcript_26080/g.30896 Transcript_26080/m.30896 type:complete len:561 (-) Transcript_26080:109-1791(-)